MNLAVRRALPALFLLLSAAPLLWAVDSSPGRFEKEIKAYEASDQKSPPPTGAILFTGSSSIRRWTTLAEDFPEHKVINRGFGGSQLADVIYYADRIIIPYKPKLIVVGAGGNDINAGKTPQQVLADFQTLVDKVRAKLPETRIAFIEINPSPARWSQSVQQREANRLVRDYVDKGENLDYIELFDALLGPDGKPREDLYVADRLHPNAEGYKLRTLLIRPHLPQESAEK
jgi:lysophospholipase L1-like esterase